MAVHVFCHKGCVISEMTRDKAIVTAERQKEDIICALSNGDISNDLDGFQGHVIFEVEYLKYGAH